MDDEAARLRLDAMRRDLEDERAASADGRAAVALDQQSVGRLSRQDALQRQAMAKAEDRRRALALKRITAALARLDAGAFGSCAVCGEDIAPKRLEHDPSIAVCVACAP